MNFIKQTLILMAFFLFFIVTACGNLDSNKNELTIERFPAKERYVPLEDRYAKVNIDEEQDSIAGYGSGGMGFKGSGIGGGGTGYGRIGSTGNINTGGGRGTTIMLSKGRRGEYKIYDRANSEKYGKSKLNDLKRVSENPLSTFSIDVDTASYSIVKSMIKDGGFNKDAVRTEEFINYFTYDYPQPKNNEPFSVTTEVGPSILNNTSTLLTSTGSAHRSDLKYIVHIGIQGRKKADEKRKAANLVFLIDTSGSMSDYNKLPLLKKSLNILTDKLTEKDTVTIVTYAGDSYVALAPANGNNKNKIKEAINKLETNGGTNGEGGILVAYEKAKENYSKNKINRIILCTDGDFNIGVSSVDELKTLVKEKRKTGITLSSIGFGRGNYNDAIMEKLANNGNGNYFYINSEKEAKKVFSKELTANLEVIAKDVKIQVEFNPKVVSFYRLIGYENRLLKKEDFNNDKVDAGEIGSGHTVTALYEIVLKKSKNQPVDNLRYNNNTNTDSHANVRVGSHAYQELAYLKLRHKLPNGKTSKLRTYPILTKNIIKEIKNTSNNFRFSSSVAAFASKLKGIDDNIEYKDIIEIATNSKGSDEFSYRKEFIELVKKFKNHNVSYAYRGYPQLKINNIKTSSNISKESIEKIIKRKSRAFRYCYEKELQRGKDIEGTIILKAKTSKLGKVIKVSIDSAIKDERINACFKRQISRIKFLKTSDEKEADLNIKMTFSIKK